MFNWFKRLKSDSKDEQLIFAEVDENNIQKITKEGSDIIVNLHLFDSAIIEGLQKAHKTNI